MELNLAPWYYRNLLIENPIIEMPIYYKVINLLGIEYFETNISLKKINNFFTISQSELYNNCDGSGADEYKNISTYKAISEALERLAFYESINSNNNAHAFSTNPTTTGMAAFPHFTYSKSRTNAKSEAVERWAIHEFNKKRIPVISVTTFIEGLEHYELVTPFRDNIKVSLVVYKNNDFYAYGFAGANELKNSFNKALIELNRNLKILKKNENYKRNLLNLTDSTDKTLLYYSTQDGYQKFSELIRSAPEKNYNITPKVLTDAPIIGRWTEYTKVWRYLLEDSYFPCHEDHTFFMF